LMVDLGIGTHCLENMEKVSQQKWISLYLPFGCCDQIYNGLKSKVENYVHTTR
jgi:hypothetical protein